MFYLKTINEVLYYVIFFIIFLIIIFIFLHLKYPKKKIYKFTYNTFGFSLIIITLLYIINPNSTIFNEYKPVNIGEIQNEIKFVDKTMSSDNVKLYFGKNNHKYKLSDNKISLEFDIEKKSGYLQAENERIYLNEEEFETLEHMTNVTYPEHANHHH